MTGIIIAIVIVLIIIAILLILSVRTVRPTSRGLVERFGRYNRFANPGIVFLIPFIERSGLASILLKTLLTRDYRRLLQAIA